MTDFPPAQRIALPSRKDDAGRELSGITLEVHEKGRGFPVVLCHGFPETAFSWRHQIESLSAAGFRAIAPNQRGYAGSDSPDDIADFDLEHLAADLCALLDALDIEKAVFAGHDWGGFVVWSMPLLYPDRTAGVIGVNTPYVPFPSTQLLRAAFPDPKQLYILWFQEPGVAEAELDRNVRAVFDQVMRRPGPRAEMNRGLQGAGANPFRNLHERAAAESDLLTRDEVETFARAFEQSGFRGPINWYRNIDRNALRVPGIGKEKLDLPCLMITAELDPALAPRLAEGMPAVCSDLETHMIRGCGHWTQQECPRELDELMISWLRRRFA